MTIHQQLTIAEESALFERWLTRSETAKDAALLTELLLDEGAGARFAAAAEAHALLAVVAHEIGLARRQAAPAAVIAMPRRPSAISVMGTAVALAATIAAAVLIFAVPTGDAVNSGEAVVGEGLGVDPTQPLPPESGSAEAVAQTSVAMLLPERPGQIRVYHERRSGRTVTIRVQ